MTTRFDAAAFAAGRHHGIHNWLGAHTHADGGYGFAVWAPHASDVQVVHASGGRRLRRSSDGVWRGRIASAGPGDRYHYTITTSRGRTIAKIDPMAVRFDSPSGPDAVIDDATHRWSDGDWIRSRSSQLDRAMSTYEVHLGSWRRAQDGSFLGYREVADRLTDYVSARGFTHVELMPLAEHPYYGSWGYQGIGYFAPTCRYGSPSDLKVLVDTLHQAGIGVILDWVPSHFAGDGHGLARFDGAPLYEHRDRRKGIHPDWSSPVFDHEKGEVRSFLLSSAHHWLDRYHIDGLRVDAVASMLYLDYSREPGEWTPNEFGGNENVASYEFLRSLNDMVHTEFPGVVTIAEESTAWPGVTRPTPLGGVGFDLKWDMGWMHDSLRHMRRRPSERPGHGSELTFRMMYAHTEQYVLALSHDEVVHEKASLLSKMPGPDRRRFDSLRALYGYQWALPGRKLLFMGGEFAQWREWDHESELEWELLRWKPHQGMQRWVSDLNTILGAEPALSRRDFDPSGFAWIDADEQDRGLLAFCRYGEDQDRPVTFVANLSGSHRRTRIGVPVAGRWQILLNSDGARYGGSGRTQGRLSTDTGGAHGHDQTLLLALPANTALYLAPVITRRARSARR